MIGNASLVGSTWSAATRVIDGIVGANVFADDNVGGRLCGYTVTISVNIQVGQPDTNIIVNDCIVGNLYPDRQ